MRPLELRLRNFRSYFGDETTFSFRDRSLVGIVGPIGSGKSSILDAIAFALYGKTPTVAAATKGLIHHGRASYSWIIVITIWRKTITRISAPPSHCTHRLTAF